MAHPSKYKDVDLKEVSRMAGLGLNVEQMSASLGIAEGTFYEWQKTKPEFSHAIKEGRSSALQQVANALFQNAMEGNTTAQVFYLKNRSRQEWGDKEEKIVKIKVEKESDLDNLSDEELAKLAE